MSQIFSDNFTNELMIFKQWFNNNNYKLIQDSVEYSINDIEIIFKEPSRNKLNCYLKQCLDKYIILTNQEEIIDNFVDIKILIKNFKEYKKNGKFTNKNQKTCIVDNTLNTDNCHYIESLEYYTNELENALGKPVKSFNHDKIKFEWKFKFGQHIYHIYDWDFGESPIYQNLEWFVGSNSNSKTIDKCFLTVLKNVLKKKINLSSFV